MKQKLMMLFLCFTILFTAGCWDVKDISNRAFVTAIGIDVSSDAEEYKQKVTFEIVNPAQLLNMRGENKAAKIYSVEAESINMAIEVLQDRISKPLTLAHMRILLLGDKLARKENIASIMDYFRKHPDVALRMRMMVVQDGEASEVLKLTPQQERYLSADLVEMTQLKHKLALARTIELIHFLDQMNKTGGSALGTGVAVNHNEELVLYQGGAVFSDWKLKGWLTGEETKYANWILSNVDSHIWGENDSGAFSYLVQHSNVRITPENVTTKPVIKIFLRTNGTLRQEQLFGQKRVDFTKPENILKIENLFSGIIKTQVESALHKAQKELKTDYLGLGLVINNKDPKAYKTINWDQLFPDVKVLVQVQCHVTRFGLSP